MNPVYQKDRLLELLENDPYIDFDAEEFDDLVGYGFLRKLGRKASKAAKAVVGSKAARVASDIYRDVGADRVRAAAAGVIGSTATNALEDLGKKAMGSAKKAKGAVDTARSGLAAARGTLGAARGDALSAASSAASGLRDQGGDFAAAVRDQGKQYLSSTGKDLRDVAKLVSQLRSRGLSEEDIVRALLRVGFF